jgi:glycerate kinase
MVLRRSLGVDVEHQAGAGAAGGLAAGLMAFLGAHSESGFDIVAEATGLVDRVARADIVVTGEGSFDSQSRQGKVTGRLLAMARDAGKRCIVFAGRSDEPGDDVRTIASVEPDTDIALRDAARLLEELAARWAAEG